MEAEEARIKRMSETPTVDRSSGMNGQSTTLPLGNVSQRNNPNGMPGGMPGGMPRGMPSGMPSGMPGGMPGLSGMPRGMPNMPGMTPMAPPSGLNNHFANIMNRMRQNQNQNQNTNQNPNVGFSGGVQRGF